MLARADAARLRDLGEAPIPLLSEVEVLRSRTGLVMQPMRDTAQGRAFHLSEVLVAEAHVRSAGVEGCGMSHGRDLEAAMAMAPADIALALGPARDRVAAFLGDEAAPQAEADDAAMREVEATSVAMETF